ncbi:transfer complex protein [Leifsonia xyli subsp. cynodontis DSM 46306]|uniref:Uncharacterized protein n=1 Tax=Leifsonia xyli subsp. cynodontis DSM 46306 TaxID=1389489 RepID=U3P798_LEIXC|nr:hypothetical protein [Leifsonia xyli]AGW40802.1 transfer complex protein [Leifsonia xyli subsp. cynodontis DSM 46306]
MKAMLRVIGTFGDEGSEGSGALAVGVNWVAAPEASSAPCSWAMRVTSALIHALAICWASCGVRAVAVTLMIAVSCGWVARTWPVRAPGLVSIPRSSMTSFATSSEVAC